MALGGGIRRGVMGRKQFKDANPKPPKTKKVKRRGK